MAVALIVAAGLGERLGADRPKALVELAGRTLIQWSVDLFRGVDAVDRIVVALPAGADSPPGVTGVLGGAVRSESVRRALTATVAVDPSETVIVHDAARPLATVQLVERVLAALAEEPRADAAIAALPCTDTVKLAGDDRFVSETLDRRSLWAVQTPQAFRRPALERALDVPEEILRQATDDASLIERAGGRVLLVPGGEDNLKVTTALDLRVAELLLAARAG
jgi:2-C-methyl-D-erythritol 4-phosphate cytidylyltransferase